MSINDPSPEERVGGTFTKNEARQAKRLTMVLGLIAAFFVLELAGAMWARSNVLKADALHLLMDVFALAMSLMAMRLAVRRPTPRFTFGLRRAEPVAAIFNAMLVLGATVEIIRDGVEQLRGGEAPEAGIMLFVSIGALFVNGLSAWLLHDVIGHAHHDHGDGHGHAGAHAGAHAHAHAHAQAGAHAHAHAQAGAHAHAHAHEHEHEHDEHAHAHAHAGRGHTLNLRGARLHLLGDTLGSLAALVAAIVIKSGGPSATDPIASFVVAFILVLGAAGLLRDATLVLLEAAPKHLPIDLVRRTIETFPEVCEVHDMHVWTLGAGHDAIIVHVRVRQLDAGLATRLAKKLRDTFKTEYVTVQVEKEGATCDSPPSRYAD